MRTKNRKKLVIIGNGGSGKTSLLTVFSKGTFPQHYVPTVFENDVKDVKIENDTIELAIWDTAGQLGWGVVIDIPMIMIRIVASICRKDFIKTSPL